ncbi:MAG: hypothetical protein K8T90_11505 [Planctomycetes bacterium]|nr:hypothetical protein [Planctomycetota bacterium]
MTPKGMGIALLVVAAVCAFIAVERYQTNAANFDTIQANPLTRWPSENKGRTWLRSSEPAARRARRANST